MTKITLFLFFYFFHAALFGQIKNIENIKPSTTKDFNLEDDMIKRIKTANENNTFKDLSDIINDCKLNLNKSEKVTTYLSKWLEENNSIYKNKSFNEVFQFRAYLLYSFAFVVKNENVLKYLIYELNYSDNLNIIGASIYTARLYNDSTLNLLIEPYTADKYNLKVNFTDFQIGIDNNSTIKDEAVTTLKAIKKQENKIEVKTNGSCCSSENIEAKKTKIDFIEKKDRKKVSLDVEFYDQENLKCNFAKFIGKPFLITFFYSSCTNQNKCASSVAKLKEFQEKTESMNNKIGIYLITYDPYIDKPDVLKKYGEVYNFKFSPTSKFLLPSSESASLSINTFFNTSVNYGNGVVNQHGTQLYIFDKKGKLAFKFENELWLVEDLVAIFSKLEAE